MGYDAKPRRAYVALALAIAFGAWEVCFAGFMADDFFQLIVLEGLTPASSRPGIFDLYPLSDGDPARGWQ
jgi:hypothetical protein